MPPRSVGPAGELVAGTVGGELRATLGLALPLAGAQLAQVLMSFTSAAMMGHLGGDALAAGGLGNGLYFTVTLVIQGTVIAVGPLAAHARGAGEGERVGAIVGHGLLIAAALAIVGMLLVAQIPLFLRAIGHAPPLAAAVGRYLDTAVWGMPAALGYATFRSYLSAMGRTLPMMIVLVCCLGLNAALTDILIFGRFGVPALEVTGAGIANAAVQWVQFGALALYVAFWRGSPRIFAALARPRLKEMVPILRLGWPISGILAMEAGVFSTTGLMAGLLGTAALAAHQIALNITSINFTAPLALAQATTVRVALARGAGNAAAARRAGFVALACGTCIMALFAVILFVAPRPIIAIYLDLADPGNAPAIAIGLRLLFIAALFAIFDGGQAIAAGALRGLRDTTVPLVIAGVGYWGFGFVSAWALAFPAGLGATGLWWGLLLGLVAVAVPLAYRFHSLTAG